MNKRIRKKKQKQAWARVLERMRQTDYWKRAKPTGWAYAGDNATWAMVSTTSTTSFFEPGQGE